MVSDTENTSPEQESTGPEDAASTMQALTARAQSVLQANSAVGVEKAASQYEAIEQRSEGLTAQQPQVPSDDRQAIGNDFKSLIRDFKKAMEKNGGGLTGCQNMLGELKLIYKDMEKTMQSEQYQDWKKQPGNQQQHQTNSKLMKILAFVIKLLAMLLAELLGAKAGDDLMKGFDSACNGNMPALGTLGLKAGNLDLNSIKDIFNQCDEQENDIKPEVDTLKQDLEQAPKGTKFEDPKPDNDYDPDIEEQSFTDKAVRAAEFDALVEPRPTATSEKPNQEKDSDLGNENNNSPSPSGPGGR